LVAQEHSSDYKSHNIPETHTTLLFHQERDSS
jgi:hypothetical protein